MAHLNHYPLRLCVCDYPVCAHHIRVDSHTNYPDFSLAETRLANT